MGIQGVVVFLFLRRGQAGKEAIFCGRVGQESGRNFCWGENVFVKVGEEFG